MGGRYVYCIQGYKGKSLRGSFFGNGSEYRYCANADEYYKSVMALQDSIGLRVPRPLIFRGFENLSRPLSVTDRKSQLQCC